MHPSIQRRMKSKSTINMETSVHTNVYAIGGAQDTQEDIYSDIDDLGQALKSQNAKVNANEAESST